MPQRSTVLRGIRRALTTFAAVVLVAPMSIGCATIDPDPGWRAPAWSDAPGVRSVVQVEPGEGADPAPDPEPDQAEPGFIEGRIRNDAVQLQARYVELPGVHVFNTRVSELLREAIGATGKSFEPEVFPVDAGLGDRGCVPGSLSWPAERVLASPETGPTGGSGTAVTCEIVAMFASVVAVSMRTVTGTEEAITRDARVTLYADLASGGLHEGSAQWNGDASPGLWLRAVEQLRRASGGLSAAPLAAPPEDQLALATRALETVRHLDGGGATLTIPPGLASPELAGLGIDATAGATVVEVDAETLSSWESELAAELRGRAAEPFVGLPAWNGNQGVDCGLVACVAVTYDDGPSAFTTSLLDTLLAERAPATLFMLGGAARGMPEVVRRAVAEGHELGSHTMTHPDLTRVKPEEARREVLEAGSVLSELTGLPITTFRPPYGALNDKALDAIGLPAVLWSVDTLDWKTPGTEALVQRSVGEAAVGDIILFHDTHAETVEAASAVFGGLRNRGFTPVTVTQLFGGDVPNGRVSER